MKDKTRLAITGVVAFVALAATIGGHGLNFDFDFDDDARANGRESGGDGDAEGSRTLAGLRDFRGVDLAGPDDVVITQGKDYSVRADGTKDALDQLDVKVKNGTLSIGRKDRSWFGERSRTSGAVVHVTVPALDHVSLTGPGDMKVDRLEGSQVKAELTGPGNLEIATLKAERASLSITGSGDLTVKGGAKQATLNATGSGNVHAEDLTTEQTTIEVIGSGDVTVHASQSADISIMGSGDARVIGTSSCKINKMGSGEAQCTAS